MSMRVMVSGNTHGLGICPVRNIFNKRVKFGEMGHQSTQRSFAFLTSSPAPPRKSAPHLLTMPRPPLSLVLQTAYSFWAALPDGTVSILRSLCSHLLLFEGSRNFLFNWPVVTVPFQVVLSEFSYKILHNLYTKLEINRSIL